MNTPTPKESYKQTRFQKRLQGMGYEVYKHPPTPIGTPDLHAFKKGRHYWFEVKRSEAEFKKDFINKNIQKKRRKKIRKAGDTVCVVWLWDHIEDALDGKKTPKFRR